MIKKLSQEEIDALFGSLEKDKRDRAEKMPTEKDAIRQIFEAQQRLEELGWRNVTYCPKDGSMFSVIELGSTGIHKCNYQGDWPDGKWWIYDGDVWPGRPIMWRERKDSDPEVDLGPVILGRQCCEHYK